MPDDVQDIRYTARDHVSGGRSSVSLEALRFHWSLSGEKAIISPGVDFIGHCGETTANHMISCTVLVPLVMSTARVASSDKGEST
jgi:hypothetical protein